MRSVGRYAIYDEIASGGMASVHFARLGGPAGSARTVAVKRMHPHLAREIDFAHMFLDEARVASRIHHPNVVSTIDVLETADDLVLVMDYVHGESLWRLVRAVQALGEPVPVPIAASIVIDVLHGLHAAHEATDERGQPLGIVHRDVSPQNILVGADGVARLVDFGIAKAVGRLHTTRDSTVKGKYAYMAPEQVRGEEVSRVTDTYAAGVVLWELLTGERLFAGKTEAETIHRALVARVQPPSVVAKDVGTAFDALVRKAISREPARRYATAREMALDLEACIAPVSPSEIGAWVVRVAGDTLAARARTVAEIERAAPREAEEAAPSPRSRTRALAAVGLLALLGAGVATAVVVRRAPAVTPSTAPPPPSALVTAGLAATGSAPAASVPIDTVASTVAASPVVPPAARAPARAPATSRPPRAAPKRADCDPPYSIDSAGRQIFKPECM